MAINDKVSLPTNDELNWLTIQEALAISSHQKSKQLTEADIYRHVLYGGISLSIYFQSPVLLRKIQIKNKKVRLKSIDNSLINRLCTLDKDCFIYEKHLVPVTSGEYIHSLQRVIDTDLFGYEYVLIQHLLANSLGIPPPTTKGGYINYGLTVNLYGDIFQVFENISYQERIDQQLKQLPEDVVSGITNKILAQTTKKIGIKGYFPLHNLPPDACFVIKHSEFEKLINLPSTNAFHPLSPTRISTPLARLFWLACKNNEIIRPLIKQPYKLLSIFEQWALIEGITDRFSGDTLKTALERGSPTSI